jgi:hypothetical protein
MGADQYYYLFIIPSIDEDPTMLSIQPTSTIDIQSAVGDSSKKR